MKYYQLNDKWICVDCGREFLTRQATTSHIYRSHTNPGVSFGGHQVGKPAWNKGLVGVQVSPSKGKPGTFTGKTHTAEARRLISQRMSANNKGGRCKWFEVSGQKVQGTWERNVAVKLNELGIKWEKLKINRHTFDYQMDDKIRSYTPDFYLPDSNVYLEIKVRWWGRDKEKMDIVMKTYPDKNIIIVEKYDYEKILRGELVW